MVPNFKRVQPENGELTAVQWYAMDVPGGKLITAMIPGRSVALQFVPDSKSKPKAEPVAAVPKLRKKRGPNKKKATE